MLEDVPAPGIAGAFAHELLVGQRREVRLDMLDAVRRGRRAAYGFEHAVLEDAADDGRRLRHALGGVGQPVDAGRQHAGERIGNGDVGDLARGTPVIAVAHDLAAVDQRAEHLLEVEGVALRALEDLPPDALGQVLDAQQVAQQLARGLIAQWLEVDARERSAQARLQPVEQLPAWRLVVGAEHRKDEQRLEGGKGRDLREQFQRRAVGPVQVVHDEDEGAHAATRTDRRLEGIDDGIRHAMDDGVAADVRQRDPAVLGIDGQHGLVEGQVLLLELQPLDKGRELLPHLGGGVHVVGADQLAAELPPWVIGNRLAIGDGARLEPGGSRRRQGVAPVPKLGDEPRLAQSRLADGDDGAAPRCRPASRSRSRPISASRPTSAEDRPSSPRVLPGMALAPVTSKHSTGSLLPFISILPRGLRSKSARTSFSVSALISTVPGSASDCSRAATLAASPSAVYSLLIASPTKARTAVPVLMPTRRSKSTPCRALTMRA